MNNKVALGTLSGMVLSVGLSLYGVHHYNALPISNVPTYDRVEGLKRSIIHVQKVQTLTGYDLLPLERLITFEITTLEKTNTYQEEKEHYLTHVERKYRGISSSLLLGVGGTLASTLVGGMLLKREKQVRRL